MSTQTFISSASQHRNNLHAATAQFSQCRCQAQNRCYIICYPPLPALSQRPTFFLFCWVKQRVPTEQATRIGLASLRAFALLLSLLAPSKATKTLHELQHALTRWQLLVMPRTERKTQCECRGNVLLTPNRQVWENKTPEIPCGCRRSPACWRFSSKPLGCGLWWETFCSRLPNVGRQALPVLIPAYSNSPASICGHGEKFKVCPACSHRAFICQPSEASETEATFPSGSAHAEKVRNHLISSLV